MNKRLFAFWTVDNWREERGDAWAALAMLVLVGARWAVERRFPSVLGIIEGNDDFAQKVSAGNAERE